MKNKCLLVLLGLLVNMAVAEPPLSYEQVLNHESGICEFMSLKESAPDYQCTDCLSFIDDNAGATAKNQLINELHDGLCHFKYERKKQKSGKAYYIDNDVLALDSWTGFNKDRNYTMGFGWASFGEEQASTKLAGARDWLDSKTSIHTSKAPIEIALHTTSYGITAFTPGNIKLRTPIHGDRPFSSLIYLSNSKMNVYKADYAIASEFAIGVLGLDIAKGGQRFLHNGLDTSNQDPRGWDNQISEGGELTLLYAVERVAKLSENQSKSGWLDWDISYTAGAKIGYYTEATAGFNIRFGKIESEYFTLNSNPLGNFNHAKGERKKDNYLFLTYQTDVVAYNALLQGQFRHSNVKFSGSDIERVLHQASAGWSFGFCKRWQFTYALSYQSAEFDSPFARDHWFGGIYLTRLLKD